MEIRNGRVHIGYEEYDIRNDNEEIPKQMAWCKKCAAETSKIVYKIWMNNKPAYALECIKCGSRHHMYKDMYIRRYIGSNMKGGGHINPTKGIISISNAMDRKGHDTINEIHKKSDKRFQSMLGMSDSEYEDFKKKREKEDTAARKQYEAEKAEIRANIINEEIKRESDKRKELIEKGILIYKKGIGLVNTETGQVMKI